MTAAPIAGQLRIVHSGHDPGAWTWPCSLQTLVRHKRPGHGRCRPSRREAATNGARQAGQGVRFGHVPLPGTWTWPPRKAVGLKDVLRGDDSGMADPEQRERESRKSSETKYEQLGEEEEAERHER